MDVNGVKFITGQSSISSKAEQDLQLFKWAQSNDIRRRSSDATRQKWILDNMKDGNQSDDEDDDDPLGFLNDDLDDFDDSPISSRADSKSPQVLFPPDSLWEESRRDSFFDKARRDSIRWVEENKQVILREMKENDDGVDAVPDTPVLKRNSYMEQIPDVPIIVTSHDDDDEEPSDDEPAEPPRSWIASAIRRLSQVVVPETIEKDLSELKTQGRVALEIREIETKRRGSQSVSHDVVKLMAEWEKERREQNESADEQDNTDHQNQSGSRRNSYREGDRSREDIRRSSISSNGHARKSISHIDDTEVKVIITSPDDESEEMETPRSWLSNTIRRLSNVSNIDDSINSNRKSSIESANEQDSNYENSEIPKGRVATAIRRLSSAGENSINDNESEEEEYEKTRKSIRRASTGSPRKLSLKDEDRRQSKGKISPEGSRRGSYKSDYTKDEDRRQSLGRASAEGSRRGSYKSDYTKNEDRRQSKGKISAEGSRRGSHKIDYPPDAPTEWLATAIRRLSSVSTGDSHLEERKSSIGRSVTDTEGEKIDFKHPKERRSSSERRNSSRGAYRNENVESFRRTSGISIHSDQDQKEEADDVFTPEDTPTGWLAKAVRRLSSTPTTEGSNIEERSATVRNDDYSKTSRSASQSSIQDEQDSKDMLSPEDTPTGWLASAVRRLSSVSYENNINVDERRASTGSTHSNSGMQTSQETHRSRHTSENSSNTDNQQDSNYNLSPEDTPTGWLANAVRRLSSVAVENDVRTDERRASTGSIQSNHESHSYQGSPRSKSPSNYSLNLDAQQDSKNLLSSEDTPTGWLASAVRRLSSVAIENNFTEEERSYTENAHNLGDMSSQGSHGSRSSSRNSLNSDEQKDSKYILSPEDTPTGWLANAVRRLSSVAIENDDSKEERRLSIEDTNNLGDEKSPGSYRSRNASRDPLYFEEQNNSKNVLSPEDTPSGWLANAVRRLSSASREDIDSLNTQQGNIPSPRSSPSPSDMSPPTVPYASSEEEEEIQVDLGYSTIRRPSSSLRGSEIPPIEEELENENESFSTSETQQLNLNQKWLSSAVRRLSMRDEEPIKLPQKIQRMTSEIHHQNIVKPMVNEDANESDYTPVFISKKKIGKGMAWQNGFDWDITQGAPDITFCGCGFLGVYMVGVAEVLLEERPEILQGRIGGSSVGSLVAACLVTGVPLQKLRQALLHVADLSQAYTLGPLNPWFNLEEPLLEGLLEMMPQDAHIKASGKLFLSLTRLSNLTNEVVSEYPSRDELLRAILCCCWLPGISSFTAPTFMGTSYIDGAFTGVNPWSHLPNNLSVSAYSGSLTICPDDSDRYPYQPQVTANGISYNMQPENGKRAVDALMPPPGDVLDKYYHNGVYDTHIFLRTQG